MFRAPILIVFIALAAIAQPVPPAAQSKFVIGGTATDSVRGNPVPGIEMSLYQRQSLLQTTTTDSSGHFEFTGFGPGKYGLSAHGPGYQVQEYEQHWRFNTGIVVGSGIESGNLVFRLKPESSISGTVTDEFNEPVRSGEVYLFFSGISAGEVLPRHKSKISDSGTYYFEPLTEGNYYLVVAAHPWYARQEADSDQPTTVDNRREEPRDGRASSFGEHRHSPLDVAFPTTYYVNARDSGQATMIALKPGENANLDFHLSAVPALRLRVRGVPAVENATGPLKLSEQIFGVSRLVTTKYVGNEGGELTGLAPGHYVLEYPAQGSNQAEQQPIDLEADMEVGPGEGSRLTSKVMGTVELGAEGLCVRCKVRLVHLPSYQLYDAQSGSKGFQIERPVRPGRYHVLVMMQEGYCTKEITAVGARVVGTDVEIPAGADVRLTIFMTKDFGTITGLAIRDGKPASAAAIDLVPDNPMDNFVRFRADQSDSDGSFELREIVPGSYTVIAVAEGWNLDEQSPDALKRYLGGGVKVQVRAGDNLQVKLNVQAKAGVSK
jgi:hypothetical protein